MPRRSKNALTGPTGTLLQALPDGERKPNITVLLADEHPLVIEGLRRILPSAAFTIVGVANDGQALLKAAEELHPDLIISCVNLPLLNGIEAAWRTHRAGIRSKIILLSKDPDAAFAAKALRAGVNGFLPKTASPSEVLRAVHQALQGKPYVPPAMEQAVNEQLLRDEGHYGLTAREREILQLLSEGKTPKEIARILKISPRTVEFHKYSMLEKLGLGNTAELIVWGVRQGLR